VATHVRVDFWSTGAISAGFPPEADLGMFSMFGQTGAPHEETHRNCPKVMIEVINKIKNFVHGRSQRGYLGPLPSVHHPQKL